MQPRPSRRLAVLSAADLEAGVDRIGTMTIEQLRAEWRAVRKALPPSGLSKDVMARELAYRLQERALGGLSPEIRRMLRASGEPSRQIKLGSLIVREHQGLLHEVVVVPGGFSWCGKTYASLSTIARLITGTSWNGPRFFGLRTKRKAGQAEVKGGSGGALNDSASASDCRSSVGPKRQPGSRHRGWPRSDAPAQQTADMGASR